MDLTHIHLLINHLPVFGSLIGALILAYGIWSKSSHTQIAAYALFILSAIGAGVAYLTGEAAEETVENIQGVAKNLIDQHEDFAIISLVAILALGVAAIGGIYLNMRKSTFASNIAKVILTGAIVTFAVMAKTGYDGGQIRHTEINNAVTITPGQNGEVESDD